MSPRRWPRSNECTSRYQERSGQWRSESARYARKRSVKRQHSESNAMVLAKSLCAGRRLAFFASFGMASWSSNAFAYRPFDSTDPAVADLNSFEVELSPLSYRHDDSGRIWIAPQLRLNYGFAKDWEVVLEGQGEHERGFESRLVENALSLKYIIKEGTLQDMLGP